MENLEQIVVYVSRIKMDLFVFVSLCVCLNTYEIAVVFLVP